MDPPVLSLGIISSPKPFLAPLTYAYQVIALICVVTDYLSLLPNVIKVPWLKGPCYVTIMPDT